MHAIEFVHRFAAGSRELRKKINNKMDVKLTIFILVG